jgi:hypothetical protein
MSESAQVKSVGGIAPFGYRWQDGALIIDKTEAPIRKLIYELFLKHRRKKTVATLLNDAGYRTRSGAMFSDTTVDRLIRDTTAKGIRVVDGKEIEVEPIVEIEVWQQANNILNSNSNQKMTKQAVQLFSGLAFCSCGGKMIVPSNSPKYVCINCRHKIPTKDLEEIFTSQFAGFLIPIDDSGQGKEMNLTDYWQYLTDKEKRIIIENAVSKIVIGAAEIKIEFGYAPNSIKTVVEGQQNSEGNRSLENEMKEPNQEMSAHQITAPLYSETKAAEFLGISKMTLLRKRNAGEIGFFRVGFRVLYSKEKHLLPFLESCEKGK